MINFRLGCFLLFILLLPGVTQARKYLSPLDYGIADAKNGYERYDILLRCHLDAVELGKGVSYQGIDSLYIEIPQDATGIPLSDYTDFSGVVLTVCNTQRDLYLFTKINPVEEIQLEADKVDVGDFRNENLLTSGNYIIIVKDENPWVDERKGFGYPHIRRDVLYVKDGRALNHVIKPYDNLQSKMTCRYRQVHPNRKLFSNLSFYRTRESTFKTCLLRVVAEHNFIVKNINVVTPINDELYADHIFMVEDCTCFTLQDVVVDGTYSLTDKYGYAFGLDNVWCHKALRVKADGKWGVYGTNNVNTAALEDCKINRFDIHCYGRDILCKNCHFYRLYNSFGATYDNVVFNNCSFDHSRPYLTAGSYNSFVEVNVIFTNCKFFLSPKYPWIAEVDGMPAEINKRPELAEKYLPNIMLRRCNVVLPGNNKKWFIINARAHDHSILLKGGRVEINKLKIEGAKSQMLVHSENINLGI